MPTIDDDFINSVCCTGLCVSCSENVGPEDSKTILEEIRDGEKVCVWCGEDFELDENGEVILCDIDLVSALKNLNEKSHYYFNYRQGTTTYNAGTSYYNDGNHANIVRIDARARYFRELKESDPGLADEQGNPRDRIQDAVPYEEISKGQLLHHILEYVAHKPNETASAIYKNVGPSRKTRFHSLEMQPLSRLCASGLLSCDSKFIGFQKVSEKSRFEMLEKIPKFTRKYKITEKGKRILALLNKDDKRGNVLL